MVSIGDYIDGFAIKRLANVDVNKMASHQHEFNGTRDLIELIGKPVGKQRLKTKMAYLDDSQEALPPLFETSLTWYDARANHKTRSELRLLYLSAAEPIIYAAEAGDVLFLIKQKNGEYLLLIAAQGSTVLRELQWIFAVQSPHENLEVQTNSNAMPQRDEIASEELFSWLGIVPDEQDPNLDDLIIKRYPTLEWPSTHDFSNFARSLVTGANPIQDPDGTLLSWVNMEHRLFRSLEKLLVEERISRGFVDEQGQVDVEGFTREASSILNRRKSRAGLSLEEHLGEVLRQNGVVFVKKAKTEGKKEPDFLFPSKKTYDDERFPSECLTMLGSKTTLKDRWRQVLNEANRIPNKHLFTLQPGISEDQTAEMQSENLQLVIPRELHKEGFTVAQRRWLMGFDDFIAEIKSREIIARPQYPHDFVLA